MKKIRSIGTTRDSLDKTLVAKLLGAESCGEKIKTNQNPMSLYIQRKYTYNKVKNK